MMSNARAYAPRSADEDSGDSRICLGAVVGAHGVSGEVKIKSFTAEPDDIAAFGPLEDEAAGRSFELAARRGSGDLVIARIAEIDDRDAAQALKGTKLFVSREALGTPPDDEYYHVDLIGLRAERENGEAVGRVRAIHNFGAGDMIEIESGAPGGAVETAMVPFTAEAVTVVDIAGGRLVVAWPDDTPDDAPGDVLEDAAT